MSTIFQKLAASGDNCLILGLREPLIYPFNVGTWTDLRIGMTISVTNSTSDNGTYASESVTSNQAVAAYYCGLTNAVTGLPFTSNHLFWGVTNPPTGGLTTRLDDDGGGNNAEIQQATDSKTFFSVSSGILNKSEYGTTRFVNLPSVSNSLSTGAYARFFGLRYLITGDGSESKAVRISAIRETADNGDVRIEKLRNNLSTLPNEQTSSYFFWTNNFVASQTGIPLQTPDRLIMYFPFINNRIRIHSLLIEKWA